MRAYQICSTCVMDTSDAAIVFDDGGVCDHCQRFYRDVLPYWHTDERGRKALERIVDRIRSAGRGRDYDCLIGVSGGVDSSYLLHVAVVDYGLRPLVFHVDGGWDSQVAVSNIESLIDRLGLELYTEVINWEEMRDLQLAYFKAGVSNIDVPQDHAFVAALYHFAREQGSRYILNGGNYSTECVRNPLEFYYYGTDMAQMRDIHSRYGTRALKEYPLSGILWHKVYLRYVCGIRVVKPLNYVPYVKADAMRLLSEKYGWQSYRQKHFESRFTRFYEGYWLPTKFGFDPRRVQFSSLILTKQMRREDALMELERPALDSREVATESEYVAKKLGITRNELESYLKAPNKSYRDYDNHERLFAWGSTILKRIGVERAVKR